jgi:hypothetical protein
VTWTLTYTLRQGPVTNAVITNLLPEFVTLVSASHGGVYNRASRVVRWELGALSASGSVRIVTVVDPEAPETAPIVNVATIASDQTAEAVARDAIRVIAGAQLGGNPPSPPSAPPTVPDTALAAGRDDVSPSAWMGLLFVLFGGSLGMRSVVTVRVRDRRP